METIAKGRSPPWIWIMLSGLVAALLVLAPRNNEPIAVALAAAAALAVALVIDVATWRLFASRSWFAFATRGVLLASAGAAVGNWFRLDDSWAFRAAFAVEAPPGVSGLHVVGQFVGRQSDMDFILVFAADEVTVGTLLGARQYFRVVDDESWLAEREPKAWATIWQSHVGLTLPPPTKQPEMIQIWRWRSDESETMTVVWDVGAKRVYALYRFG